MLVFRCECDCVLGAEENQARQAGECPDCGRILRVPASTPNVAGRLVRAPSAVVEPAAGIEELTALFEEPVAAVEEPAVFVEEPPAMAAPAPGPAVREPDLTDEFALEIAPQPAKTEAVVPAGSFAAAASHPAAEPAAARPFEPTPAELLQAETEAALEPEAPVSLPGQEPEIYQAQTAQGAEAASTAPKTQPKSSYRALRTQPQPKDAADGSSDADQSVSSGPLSRGKLLALAAVLVVILGVLIAWYLGAFSAAA